MTEKTIIEINGVKLEVDLRYAKRIDELRIGDRVKVLTKQYDGHKVSPGVIVGFEPFQNLPTIVVAYVENTWNATDVKFLHFNKASKDVELVVSADTDFDMDREKVVRSFDRAMESKQREIDELQERKRYFQNTFKSYWSKFEAPFGVDSAE